MTTVKEIEELLKDDDKVQVAGTDIDGVLRGKILKKSKFLSTLRDGFGFCGVVFGWDIHDRVYNKSSFSTAETGFEDILARVDPTTFRRLPWNDNIPFFLLDFFDPKGNKLSICPRTVLRNVLDELAKDGFKAYSGIEFEFYNFLETPESLVAKNFVKPTPLTPGMFGYSLLRPSRHQEYFNKLFDELKKVDIPIEGLHTETGPGVYEVAIEYSDPLTCADRAQLFKTSAKQIAAPYGIIPSFMAKPDASLPGCSGHTHYSLWDKDSKTNLFYDAAHPKKMSKTMEHFLAGQLFCLPFILPMFCPTINSFKRMVEGAWAPVVVTWGVENRTAAIRVINLSASSTRVETRVGGADINSYLCIAASLASGLYGIRQQLPLQPESSGDNVRNQANVRLPSNLGEAAAKMGAKDSVARVLFGDAFVDHYVGTRLEEWALYQRAVTDWELKRYFELV